MTNGAVPTALLVVFALGLLTMLAGLEWGALVFVAGLVVTLVAAIALLVVLALT